MALSRQVSTELRQMNNISRLGYSWHSSHCRAFRPPDRRVLKRSISYCQKSPDDIAVNTAVLLHSGKESLSCRLLGKGDYLLI